MEIDPNRTHVAGPLATLYYDGAADPAQLIGDESPRRRLFGDDSSINRDHTSPARSLLSAFQQASSATAGSSAITSPIRSPAPRTTSSHRDNGVAQLQAPSPIASPQRPARYGSGALPSSASRSGVPSRFDSPAFRALNGASGSTLPTSPARSASAPSATSASTSIFATPAAVKRDEPSWQVYRDPKPDERSETPAITRPSAHDILDEDGESWDAADLHEGTLNQENVRPAAIIRTTPPARHAHARRGSLLARQDQSDAATEQSDRRSVSQTTPPSTRRDHTRDVTPPPTNPLLPYLEPGSALAASVRARHETESPQSREVKRRRRHESPSPDRVP